MYNVREFDPFRASPHVTCLRFPSLLLTLSGLKDEYSILNSKHFIGIHGYMLVYSVASTQSFEMVQVIRDKILNHLVSKLPPLIFRFEGGHKPYATVLTSSTGLRMGADSYCWKQE